MPVTKSHHERAERFLALHAGEDVLILPNAWDQVSAAMIAQAGFKAVATTSVGYALANGHPDGESLSRARNIGFAGAVATAAPVPVTADLEAGYGVEPDAVAATVTQAIEAGLCGCNIEDVAPGSGTLMDFDLAVARIRAGAEAAKRAGVPFVLNGRSDPYLVRFGDAGANFTEAVRRANAFLEAGARCVYVPGVTDAETLGRLARAIDGPLNAHTLGGRAALSLEEYKTLGVRRLSLGGSLMMAMLAHLRDTLAEVARGDFRFTAGALSKRDMNDLMRDWSSGARGPR